MKKTLFALAIATIATGSFAQNSQVGPYVEAVYTYGRYEEPAAWFTNGLAGLRLGYKFNQNFAGEVMGASSMGNTNFMVGSTAVSAKIDSMSGLYGKLIGPISDTVNLYAKFGVTQGRVSASTAWGRAWASGSDYSYGAGIEFKINKNVYLGLDYMSYYNKDSIQIVGTSLSLGYSF